jgi:hypothetical protein
MDITLKYSWEHGPWHEDQLASKKIYPGHQPRGGPKSWNDRKRITKESCELMVDYINNAHENAAPHMRRRQTRAEVEESAILAAVVWSLGKEVQSTMPISDQVIKLEWLDKFSKGDARIITEVQVVASEASEKFHVRDIPTLNTIMGVHSKQTPVSSSTQLSVASDGVESAEFELLMQQVEYDMQAFSVLDSKMKDFFSAREHIKYTWKRDSFNANKQAVERFLAEHSVLHDYDTGDPNVALLKF